MPGTAAEVSRPAPPGPGPTLRAMTRPGLLVAALAAIAAAAAVIARRPVRQPEPRGRWEPLERSPADR